MIKMRRFGQKFFSCLVAGWLLLSSFAFNPHHNHQDKAGKTISQVLSEARKIFGVDFIYESGIIPDRKVELDLGKYNSSESFLKELLPPFNLRFKKVLNKTYVIYSSENELKRIMAAFEGKTSPGGALPGEDNASFANNAGYRSITVTGSVTDNVSNAPLAGVSIAVKGSSKGTFTDVQGSFSLSVENENATLVFSLVGYLPQEIALGKRTSLQIVMSPVTQSMNDVVVIGYGTRKRKELTTAISSVSAKDITATPVADAAQALQGRVSGVTIVQNSGAPGGTGGTGIRIRGISSLTGTNNPLIVVDGYPLPDQQSDNVLNSFGTNDIESIDVLKDAAAASIYGVRASNGVVIITTKRGRAGKTTLNVDIYRGVQSAWRLPDMLGAREYAIANSEARVASGLEIIPKLADFNAIEAQYGQGTDWLKEIFRNAAIQNVSVTATGGSEKSQFLLSAGYFKQDGIIYKTDVERFNLRFNGDIKVNNRIRLGSSLSMNKFIERGADTYSPFNSVLILALTAPPTVTPRNTDGTYAGGSGSLDGFNEPNPIYQLEVPQNSFTKYRINGNIFTEIEPVKDLKFKALFGADFNYQENRGFSPATPSTGGRPFVLTGYNTQKGLYPDYLAEFTLTYAKAIKEKHRITTVLGYTYQENRYSYVFAGRGGDFRIKIPVLNDQAFLPTDISQTFNGAEDGINSRFISYIGRINYDFDSRGYIGFSIRRDGSSNFAPLNRWAVFPAVSAGWRLTQEPFMKKFSWINELKVRGSFGYTGNPNVPAYSYLQRVNQGFQYTFGNSSGSGGVVSAAAPSGSYNPEIRWEKNEQVNIGFDATLFKGRANISFDVYQRRSKDLILRVSPPFISGTFEPVPYNTGILQNRGIDVSLGGVIISGKDLRWNANAVLGTYKNEVITLGLGAPLDNGFARINGGSLRTSQGLPANYFFGFVTDGIFQSYAEIAKSPVQTAGSDPTSSTAPGDIKFKDLNGDGVINDQDRTNIGNANPTFTYGLTNTVSWKNLELTIFVQGSSGNKVLNFTRWYTEGGVSNGNYSKEVLNRWTGPGTSNDVPRLVLNDPNGNNRVSDRFVEDASYLRIKNVRLSYTLPTAWTKSLKLNRTQLYGSIQNLLTVTQYTGMDPEVGGGVDIGFYPQARTFLIGATIDF
jgi:TonB-dependent starch-binding outer membrane protein SusC